MRPLVQCAIAAICTLGFALLGLAGVRTALYQRAMDHTNAITSDSGNDRNSELRLAIRWRPDEADAWQMLAAQLYFNDPQQALELSRHALRLNPWDWNAWQTLAMIQWRLGQEENARQSLAAGLQYEEGYKAHLTMGAIARLLNDMPDFWREMKAALATVPANDAYSVVSDCLRASNGQVGPLLDILPAQRPEVKVAIINFLLQVQPANDVYQIWRTLDCPVYMRRECVDTMNGVLNQAVLNATAAPTAEKSSAWRGHAIDIWNQAVNQHLLSQQTRASIGTLNDGDFASPWQGPYFSWMKAETWASEHGLVAVQRSLRTPPEAGGAVAFEFSGEQPDTVSLIRQWIAVEPNRSYSVSFENRLERGNPAIGGLALDVIAAQDKVLFGLPARVSPTWQTTRGTFTVPSGVFMVRVEFVYRRPVGQMRLNGAVQVADVKLTSAPNVN